MFAAATDGGVYHAQNAADGRARDLRLDTDGSQRRGQGRGLSGAHPEYGGAARDLRGHLGDLAFGGGKVIAESDDDRSEHVDLAQRLAGDIENAGERHGRLVATEVRRRTELGDGLGELQDVVGAFDPELAGALGDGEQLVRGHRHALGKLIDILAQGFEFGPRQVRRLADADQPGLEIRIQLHHLLQAAADGGDGDRTAQQPHVAAESGGTVAERAEPARGLVGGAVDLLDRALAAGAHRPQIGLDPIATLDFEADRICVLGLGHQSLSFSFSASMSPASAACSSSARGIKRRRQFGRLVQRKST